MIDNKKMLDDDDAKNNVPIDLYFFGNYLEGKMKNVLLAVFKLFSTDF